MTAVHYAQNELDAALRKVLPPLPDETFTALVDALTDLVRAKLDEHTNDYYHNSKPQY